MLLDPVVKYCTASCCDVLAAVGAVAAVDDAVRSPVVFYVLSNARSRPRRTGRQPLSSLTCLQSRLANLQRRGRCLYAKEPASYVRASSYNSYARGIRRTTL